VLHELSLACSIDHRRAKVRVEAHKRKMAVE
jgi:hypothetical protein